MLVRIGTMFAAASGKLGNLVVMQGGRSQVAVREYVGVNTSASPYQLTVRAHLAEAAAKWRDDLSQTNRDLWETYALSLSRKNRVGSDISFTGEDAFVQSAAFRLDADLAIIEAGPSAPGTVSYTSPTISVITDPPPGNVSIIFDIADNWNVSGGAMVIQASIPRPPSRARTVGSLRKIGTIPGVGTTPASMSLPAAALEDYLVRFRVNVSAADGRIGSPRYIDVVSGA